MAIIEAEFADIGSLIHLARRTLGGFGQSVCWFRGHTRADWPLVPSVHRHYHSNGERQLTGRFRLAAPTRYANCPGLDDFPEWITLMQHFGLPTRLLDWTGSLLAAAYFAVSYEPTAEPAAIWALVPSALNKASSHAREVTFALSGPEARPLVTAAFTGTACRDDVLAVLPGEFDMRVTVQMGTFTLHGGPTPLEQRAGAERSLTKFVVPVDARATVAEELWALGVRRAALFPDLPNLAADLASDTRLIPRTH